MTLAHTVRALEARHSLLRAPTAQQRATPPTTVPMVTYFAPTEELLLLLRQLAPAHSATSLLMEITALHVYLATVEPTALLTHVSLQAHQLTTALMETFTA